MDELTPQATGLSAIGQEADEVKWTPGPWVGTEPDPFDDITIQRDGTGLAIAAVVNGAFRRMGGKYAEHLANARLIAAAPELFEALRYLSAIMACDSDAEAEETAEQLEIADPSGFIEAWRNARAALSKATGARSAGEDGLTPSEHGSSAIAQGRDEVKEGQ